MYIVRAFKMTMKVYQRILANKLSSKKSIAVLIDPDGHKMHNLGSILDLANESEVDYFFLGGSLIFDDELNDSIRFIKRHSDIPVVLFPGNETQLNENADALLLLSLISGRNPEYLISKHVASAPRIKKMGLEAISTGYMLIHGYRQTSASYISSTLPIPPDKPEIAAATAIASEMLGHKLLYLEGGSGSPRPIPLDVLKSVRRQIDLPIIVGGGIKNSEQIHNLYHNGADIIVVGTSIEKRPQLIRSFAETKREYNQQYTRL